MKRALVSFSVLFRQTEIQINCQLVEKKPAQVNGEYRWSFDIGNFNVAAEATKWKLVVEAG